MSELRVNAVTDETGGNTATINGMTPTADSLQGFRNRLINSDMRIDQRNAGASVTIDANAIIYVVDRWYGRAQATDGVFTLQQDSSAPAGFTNSLKATVTTADASIGSTQLYRIEQRIEGFNIADLGWGTASAQAVTLSFWVRSSLTGTFGGSLANSAGDRFYPFGIAISAANTWEYKTITITGDTSGTWLTNNGTGINISWSLGAGADRLGTPGAWVSTQTQGVTGQTQLISTSGATFYLTGVQLEAGSVATPFERRPFGTELQLAQRYFQKIDAPQDYSFDTAQVFTSTLCGLTFRAMVTMRTDPTIAASNLVATLTTGSPTTITSFGTTRATPNFVNANVVTSGLVAGEASRVGGGTGGGFYTLSAEL